MHQLRSDLLRKFARSLRSIAVVARCWQPVLALLDEGRREHIQADAILGPYDPSWGQFGSVSCRFGWVVQLLLVHAGRKGVDKPCWLSLQHFQSHGPQPTGEQSCLREPADWGVNHSPLRTHTHMHQHAPSHRFETSGSLSMPASALAKRANSGHLPSSCFIQDT